MHSALKLLMNYLIKVFKESQSEKASQCFLKHYDDDEMRPTHIV